MVRIEEHGLARHGLQFTQTDFARILGMLDSVIDLELLSCIWLRLELHLNLLSLYKEWLRAPLVHTIIQSIQRKG
jgi:hypothetical protein